MPPVLDHLAQPPTPSIPEGPWFPYLARKGLLEGASWPGRSFVPETEGSTLRQGSVGFGGPGTLTTAEERQRVLTFLARQWAIAQSAFFLNGPCVPLTLIATLMGRVGA